LKFIISEIYKKLIPEKEKLKIRKLKDILLWYRKNSKQVNVYNTEILNEIKSKVTDEDFVIFEDLCSQFEIVELYHFLEMSCKDIFFKQQFDRPISKIKVIADIAFSNGNRSLIKLVSQSELYKKQELFVKHLNTLCRELCDFVEKNVDAVEKTRIPGFDIDTINGVIKILKRNLINEPAERQVKINNFIRYLQSAFMDEVENLYPKENDELSIDSYLTNIVGDLPFLFTQGESGWNRGS